MHLLFGKIPCSVFYIIMYTDTFTQLMNYLKFILCFLQSCPYIQGKVFTEMLNIAAGGEEESSNGIMRWQVQKKAPLHTKPN